jgi:hypothetical protein
MTMEKLDQKPITLSDIKKYLDTRDDFAFELRALHACKARGFNSSHGGTYRDPVTEKTRQYDIRADIQRGNRRVQLAVECKSLRLFHPLVVSCTPRAPSESYHEVVLSVPLRPGRSPLPQNASVIRVEGPDSVYKIGAPVGKATAQVGKSPKGEFVTGDSEVFDKWAQAISSAQDLIAHSQDLLAQTQPDFISMTLPVLVVPDKTLWIVEYSDEGAQLSDPKQALECTLFIGKDVGSAFPLFKYTFSHLHILTLIAFEGFLDRLAVNDLYWDILIPTQAIEERLPNAQLGAAPNGSPATPGGNS